MTLGETLISVWQQSLVDGQEEVDLGQESYPVTVFRAKKLRSSVSSASESISDTIKSSVPHPGQHLFFRRAKSHLQCGHL